MNEWVKTEAGPFDKGNTEKFWPHHLKLNLWLTKMTLKYKIYLNVDF